MPTDIERGHPRREAARRNNYKEESSTEDDSKSEGGTIDSTNGTEVQELESESEYEATPEKNAGRKGGKGGGRGGRGGTGGNNHAGRGRGRKGPDVPTTVEEDVVVVQDVCGAGRAATPNKTKQPALSANQTTSCRKYFYVYHRHCCNRQCHMHECHDNFTFRTLVIGGH